MLSEANKINRKRDDDYMENTDCVYKKKAIKLDLSARNPKNVDMKGFICTGSSETDAFWILGNDFGCNNKVHCPKYKSRGESK